MELLNPESRPIDISPDIAPKLRKKCDLGTSHINLGLDQKLRYARNSLATGSWDSPRRGVVPNRKLF